MNYALVRRKGEQVALLRFLLLCTYCNNRANCYDIRNNSRDKNFRTFSKIRVKFLVVFSKENIEFLAKNSIAKNFKDKSRHLDEKFAFLLHKFI